MTTDASFGLWLKQKRIALDLTQQELADRAGCSIVTIRKFESGERRPSKQLADHLAQTLHISPDERSAFIKFARTEPDGDSFPAAPLSEMSPWRLSNRDLFHSSKQTLPLQSNPFIGRNVEIQEIEAHLNKPLAQAKAGFLAGLAEAQRLSLLNSVWHSIVGLGLVAAAEGLPERGATLLSFGTTQTGAYNRFLLGEPQRILTQLQAKLSPKDFDAAQKKAQNMNLSSLIAYCNCC